MTRAPLLQVKSLKMHFPVKAGGLLSPRTNLVRAVDRVSFEVNKGEAFGLVGESGCGKTTIGRCILKLEQPTDGQILFDGSEISAHSGEALHQYRRQVQAVFQDPFSSLNPRMSVEEIVGEPFLVHATCPRTEIAGRVKDLLSMCGLPGRVQDRYPHEMSGGQRQRVGIARALALNPDFLVCDEAVSALDVSIQAQIVRLLEDLREELGLTYLFIAHDLSVVRHICDRVAVMYLGKIAEVGESESLFADPLHPYTQGLLDAVPVPDPVIERDRQFNLITGEIPSPMNPPGGCAFHPRCFKAQASCSTAAPEMQTMGSGRTVACPFATSVREAA